MGRSRDVPTDGSGSDGGALARAPGRARRHSRGRDARARLAALALGAASVVLPPAAAPACAARLAKGSPPPDLPWVTVLGDTLSWDALRGGRPLVMVFWATWCSACKKAWPDLKDLAARYAEAPAAPAWATVSLGEPPDTVASAARERDLPGVTIADPAERNGKSLGIPYVPTVLVLDAGGRVAYLGPPKRKDLDRVLERVTSGPAPGEERR